MSSARNLFRPVDLAGVELEADSFWGRRHQINRRVTLPYEYELCKRTGRIDAFRLDWTPGKQPKPHYFWDSDLAKWIEAASYSLTTHPDAALKRRLERVTALVASAQQPDGYLNVYFTVVEPAKRWTNLRDWHELYCAGHLIEAAVAHHRATGNRTLLDAMCRYADHIHDRFGPRGRKGYPGHEEIELALVKLYRATGQRRYLELSRCFIDRRGQQPHYFDREAKARGEKPGQWQWTYEQNQSHLPVCQQKEAVGHAVRAMYLYSGMADVAMDTGDTQLLAACKRLWASVTTRKMYITGGVGALRRGEALGPDYHLPSESAYAETCAAIGLVFFAHRMLHAQPHRLYADVMEQALHNGVLSGVGLDGKSFFYENPLASAGQHHRQPWYDCACCPPNIARLLASLGTYLYSFTDKALYVHLYAAGRATLALAGQDVTLEQHTRYPWDGRIRLKFESTKPTQFDLCLRIPGWCDRFALRVNRQPARYVLRHGYAVLRRTWRNGDMVELSLEMPVRRLIAHPRVAALTGQVALQRGPLVYCLEQCDHNLDVRTLLLPDKAPIRARLDQNLLGGAVVLEGQALAPATTGWRSRLYQPMAAASRMKRIRFRAIPYCLWDNRSPGAMTVWLPRVGG